MTSKKLSEKILEEKEYSWEHGMLNSLDDLHEMVKTLSEKIDNNNEKIFSYVDKKIEQVNEGIQKIWDKKDTDVEKIHKIELTIYENKTKIENIDPRVKKLEDSKSNTMSKNFYIVLNIITTTAIGLIVGIILFFIKK